MKSSTPNGVSSSGCAWGSWLSKGSPRRWGLGSMGELMFKSLIRTKESRWCQHGIWSDWVNQLHRLVSYLIWLLLVGSSRIGLAAHIVWPKNVNLLVPLQPHLLQYNKPLKTWRLWDGCVDWLPICNVQWCSLTGLSVSEPMASTDVCNHILAAGLDLGRLLRHRAHLMRLPSTKAMCCDVHMSSSMEKSSASKQNGLDISGKFSSMREIDDNIYKCPLYLSC